MGFLMKKTFRHEVYDYLLANPNKTSREVRDHFDCGVTAARDAVEALTKNGYLIRDDSVYPYTYKSDPRTPYEGQKPKPKPMQTLTKTCTESVLQNIKSHSGIWAVMAAQLIKE